MSLFTNSYQPDIQPYYSNPEDDPAYEKRELKLKREQTATDWLAGIAGGLTEAGSAVAGAFVPGAGSLGKIGMQGINFFKNAADKGIQNQRNQINAHFPTAGGSPTNGGTNSSTGNINTDAIGKILKYLQTKNNDSTFTSPTFKGGGDNTPNPTAPTMDGTTVSPVATDSNMDWGAANTIGFSGGGLMKLQKSGADDIALVDTKDGSDTGVRVQKGEMLVVSKENLASLHAAIEKGDHKKVFNLMKEQVKQSPKVKDGKKGFQGGGSGNTDIENEFTYEGKPIELNAPTPKTYKELLERRDLLKKIIEDSDDPENFKPALKTKDPVYYESIMSKLPDTLSKLKAEYEQLEPVYNKVIQKHWKGETGLDVNANSDIEPEFLEGIKKQDYKAPDLPELDVTANKPATIGGTGKRVDVPEQISAQGYNPSDLLANNNETKPDLTKIAPDVAAETDSTGGNSRFGDYARFYAPEIAGTAYDITRGILGFNAARKPLPTFTKPEAWANYLNRLHGLSESGLTGNELTAAQRNIDTGYAADVANIRNLSGGNSGLALANLGRAAGSRFNAETNLSALNDEARARNLGEYGSALHTDLNLDRMIFNDKYQEGLWNKQSGSQLANDAIKNLGERASYIGEYAPGSLYDQLNQEQLSNTKLQNQYLKSRQAAIAKDPSNLLLYSGNSNSGNYTSKSGAVMIDGTWHKKDENGNYVPIQ